MFSINLSNLILRMNASFVQVQILLYLLVTFCSIIRLEDFFRICTALFLFASLKQHLVEFLADFFGEEEDCCRKESSSVNAIQTVNS